MRQRECWQNFILHGEVSCQQLSIGIYVLGNTYCNIINLRLHDVNLSKLCRDSIGCSHTLVLLELICDRLSVADNSMLLVEEVVQLSN